MLSRSLLQSALLAAIFIQNSSQQSQFETISQLSFQQLLKNARASLNIYKLFRSLNIVEDGQLRLGNSNEPESQLEGLLHLSRDGKWGAFCSDDFDVVAARVACRQLGHSYEGATYHSIDFNSSHSNETLVLFNKVRCRGGESNLQECSIQNLKNESKCQSSEVVYLDCTADDVSHANFSDIIRLGLPIADGVGLLEILNGSDWEMVCVRDFSPTAASVACKQLGFQYANAIPLPNNTFANLTQRFDKPVENRGLVCSGNEMSLDECRSRYCTTDRVSVSCIGSEIEMANNTQKLSIAIAMNNVTEVERLLTFGVSPNTTFGQCCSERFELSDLRDPPALVCAACYGSFGSVKALVRHGANVNDHSYSHSNALSMAAENGDFEMVKYLMENNADINERINYNLAYTLLTSSAKSGDVEMAEYFIDHGLSYASESSGSYLSLMYAVENGHVDMVRFLIDLGMDINATSSLDTMTVTGLVIKSAYVEILKLLEGMGVNWQYSALTLLQIDKQTLLMHAVENDNMEIVAYLIDRNIDINHINYIGNSATALAAKLGSFAFVNYLIERGVNVDHMHRYGNSFLTSAIIGGNLEMVKYTVELGADVNVTTVYNMSPLFLASMKGKLDIVKYLIEQGANVNDHALWNFTILASAVEHFQVVKVLVENGADVNAKIYSGETALMLACKNGTFDTVKYLVDNGAMVNAQSNERKTSLIYAIEKGRLEMVKFLIGKGANVDAVSDDDRTPLIIAASYSHTEIVKYLIENGANVNSNTTDGMTPLLYAAKDGNFQLVQYLVEKGADVHVATRWGVTALMFAATSGDLEVVKYFVQLGVDVKKIENFSSTAADFANFYGHSEISSYLQSLN